MSENVKNDDLSVGRNMKIGLFHLGSGMADVLTSGIWNRIMISDLGFSATITGLLLALKYFLAPLGVWAGRVSDERVVGGYRRLFWVWFGRALMVISTLGIGFATAQLARGATDAVIWVTIVVGFALFSLGNAISGTTFLALVYDRAPERQRGRAVGIVWTFLLLGFPIAGILFGSMLPPKSAEQVAASGVTFSPDALQTVFILAAVLFAILWIVSLVGEERRSTASSAVKTAASAEHRVSLREDLRLVWQSPTMRFFLLYLVLSMFFAFSQDTVLEPFGGDVFAMPARTTSHFVDAWGTTSIIAMVLFLWLPRRYPRLTHTVMSQLGAGILVVTFALFAVAAFGQVKALIWPVLTVFGVGLGIWNVGTLGLMVGLSPEGRAGTFLGFWTMMITFARGGGVASGGIIRDFWLQLSGNMAASYGMVFAVGAVGLVVSMWALSRVKVQAYQPNAPVVDNEQVLAGAMD